MSFSEGIIIHTVRMKLDENKNLRAKKIKEALLLRNLVSHLTEIRRVELLICMEFSNCTFRVQTIK